MDLKALRREIQETPPESQLTPEEIMGVERIRRRIRFVMTAKLTGTELVSDDDGAAEAPIAPIENS